MLSAKKDIYKYFNVILASTFNNGIGLNNKLPWKIKEEMNHFTRITKTVLPASTFEDKLKQYTLINYPSSQSNKQINTYKKNVVIMGRRTFESMNKQHLKDRINIVLSSNKNIIKHNTSNLYIANNISQAFSITKNLYEKGILNETFIIGGRNIYNEFLTKYNKYCKMIFRTWIQNDYKCDTHYKIPNNFKTVFISKTENYNNKVPYDYRILLNENIANNKLNDIINENYFKLYEPNEELQYINLIKRILTKGKDRQDRTGVGTRSLFGVRMQFDLSKSFPLLTTKNTFWRGIVEELLWFIRGQTDAGILQKKNIHIWDGNSSKNFLKKIGLGYREEGDLGPVYGFQWRHFGAEYKTMHDDYKNKGIDQLINVINLIKKDPFNRRIILSAWNPVDLKLMALPPCHILSQFYVLGNKLCLQMYQRSADIGLGVPFNIASYSLLLRLVCNVTGLLPGHFSIVIGDAHIYKNHINAIKQQINRIPYSFPILEIKGGKRSNIEDFKFSDFKLWNYLCHEKIKMKMAV